MSNFDFASDNDCGFCESKVTIFVLRPITFSLIFI
jgi:hypothetical protein